MLAPISAGYACEQLYNGGGQRHPGGPGGGRRGHRGQRRGRGGPAAGTDPGRQRRRPRARGLAGGVRRLGERGPEGEGGRARASPGQQLEAVLGLGDGRDGSGRHPPQGHEGVGHPVEPGSALAHHVQVPAGVDEGPQRLQRRPDRQVDDHAVVLEGPDGGGVAVLGLEPPDEPWALVGQGVDRLQLGESPAPRRRWWLWAGAGVATVLLVATVAWVTTPDQPRRAANQSAAGLSAAPSTTAGAVATTLDQAPDDGPKNLLANASFEDGPLGWQPLGGAQLTKTTEAREGGYSLRISAPSAGGPVGITVPDVTLTKVNGRYHTNAWMRPSSPNTTVTIGLREYRGGEPVPGSNTLGWTVERTGWRQFGAIHVAGQSGSRLALEIMARDLPPGGYLDIDEVVLHLLGNR